ncbi:MAG: SDR family NAD(P)-dependent oxidoreductase [Pseudomonadota bacterium]
MSEASPQRVIVLTGVTAGFGKKALEFLLPQANCLVIVGARDTSEAFATGSDRLTVLPLDLAYLRSVGEFCAAVKKRGAVIGGLVLNAGVSPRRLRLTKDGMDVAFQTNYLSHFAMIRAFWDDLAEDAHILITSSGTHDPAEKTPPPPPRHADARLLAWPETDPKLDTSAMQAASRAYTASKLCCTMLSLELATRRPKGTSISFDPGLVPGTSLTREFPAWLVRLLIPVMSRMMPADRTSTLPASAVALAQFIAQKALVGVNGDYVAMRGGYPVVTAPSAMARDASLRAALWRDSEAILADAAY